MRLYYHPESDSLFWSEEWPTDGLSEDVTDIGKYRIAARERGIVDPPNITVVIEAKAEPKTGGLAGAITASYKKWDRKPADFYPTPYDVTESLMPVIQTLLPNGGRIWEPCCGDLDMTRVLEWHGYEVTSTDLRDTGQGIGGIDFLNDDMAEKFGWFPDPDMIVMNPPFSLAADFIQRALSFTPNVACLMKIDYWNALSRLPLWRANMPKLFLPLTWRPAFLAKERGNSPLMNCAWCVWADSDEDYCAVEPMTKRVYPGYSGDGIRKSLAVLGQAIEGLTEVISNGRDS